MNIFINTAYENIEFFIFKGDFSKLYEIKSVNDHTKQIYKLFNKILEEETLTYNDINKIYIINGPGSFTGLRVGVIFAKTLSMELNIDIVPVDLLKILHLTLNKNIALDARGNKYFTYDGFDFSLKAKEEVESQNFQITNKINYNKLIENLSDFPSENVFDIVIDYKKDVI